MNSVAFAQATGIVPCAEETTIENQPEQPAKRSLPRWKALLLSTTALLFAACGKVDADSSGSSNNTLFERGGYSVTTKYDMATGLCRADDTPEDPVSPNNPALLPIVKQDGTLDEGMEEILRKAIGTPKDNGSCAAACVDPDANGSYDRICRELGF